MDRIEDLEKKVEELTSRRITQKDIINRSVKSRHVEQIQWFFPDLENSWENYDLNHNQTTYGLDINGFVHIFGLVKNGSSASATVFTLPEGYRPQYRNIFSVVTSPDVFCRLNIAVTGEVSFTGASTAYASMDGVIFKAYQ